MATFQFTAPDGKKYRVKGDTQEGAVKAFEKFMSQQSAGAPPPKPARPMPAGRYDNPPPPPAPAQSRTPAARYQAPAAVGRRPASPPQPPRVTGAPQQHMLTPEQLGASDAALAITMQHDGTTSEIRPDDGSPYPNQAPPGAVGAMDDYLRFAGRGLTEVGAAIPEGVALAQAGIDGAWRETAARLNQQDRQRLDGLRALMARDADRMDDAARTRMQDLIGHLEDRIAKYENVLKVTGEETQPAQDRALFKRGDEIRHAGAKTFGTPSAAREGTLGAMLAEGAGNMAGFMAGGIAGGVLKAGLLTAAGAGSALNSAQIYKEALEAGASEEDAMTAAGLGALVGSAEAIPLGIAFAPLAKHAPRVAKALASRLGKVAVDAGAEAAQEAFNSIMNNLIAQGMYDPERNTFEGVGEAMLVGAILGGGVGAGVQTADAMIGSAASTNLGIPGPEERLGLPAPDWKDPAGPPPQIEDKSSNNNKVDPAAQPEVATPQSPKEAYSTSERDLSQPLPGEQVVEDTSGKTVFVTREDPSDPESKITDARYPGELPKAELTQGAGPGPEPKPVSTPTEPKGVNQANTPAPEKTADDAPQMSDYQKMRADAEAAKAEVQRQLDEIKENRRKQASEAFIQRRDGQPATQAELEAQSVEADPKPEPAPEPTLAGGTPIDEAAQAAREAIADRETDDRPKVDLGGSPEGADKFMGGVEVASGDRVRTASGRLTSAAPKVDTTEGRKATNTRNRMRDWLLREAKAEIEVNPTNSLIDDQVRNMDNPRNLSPSDVEALHYAIFRHYPEDGKQVEVVAPKQKKKGAPKEAAPAPAPTSAQLGQNANADPTQEAKGDPGTFWEAWRGMSFDDRKALAVKAGLGDTAGGLAAKIENPAHLDSAVDEVLEAEWSKSDNGDNDPDPEPTPDPDPTPEPPKGGGGGTPRPADYGSNNKLVSTERADELRARLRKKLKSAQTNSGIDPEMVSLGTELAVYHIEAGARKFADFTKAMVADLGEGARPYLRSWYEGARYFPGNDATDMTPAAEIDAEPQSPAPEPEPATQTSEQKSGEDGAGEPSLFDGFDNPDGVVSTLMDALSNGSAPGIRAARKIVGDALGEKIDAGHPRVKQVDELVEYAALQVAKEVARKGTPDEIFASLVNKYNMMPRLGVRTSGSIERQAYSTPTPLAYAAQVLAGMDRSIDVLEPTAGMGALTFMADPDNTFVNEIDPVRRDALERQGYDPIGKDAAEWSPTRQYGVVMTNPPFGTRKDDNGTPEAFEVSQDPPYTTNQIDHAIVARAVSNVRPGGKMVALIGGPDKQKGDDQRRDYYRSQNQRSLHAYLREYGTVTRHFTVSGDLYSRQGAGWPIDVIMFEKRDGESLPFPAVEMPDKAATWEEVWSLANGRDIDVPETSGQVVETDGSSKVVGNVGETGNAGRNDGPDGDPGSGGDVSSSADGAGSGLGDRPAGDGPREQGSKDTDDELDGREPSADGDGSKPDQQRGDGDPSRDKKPVAKDANATQVEYSSPTKGKSGGTLVPANIASDIEAALDRLTAEKGDLRRWVSKELDLRHGENIDDYFMVEQIDAVALAIDNMEKGRALIVGDQTGIGKGRVMAAMIRYSIVNGTVPTFFTKDPGLYGAMFEDLMDIGIDKVLGRAPKLLPTNNSLTGKTKVPLRYDGKDHGALRTGSAAKHETVLREQVESVLSEKGLKGFDAIFSAYSQMNPPGKTRKEYYRREAMAELALGGNLILDESHLAAGEIKERKGENASPHPGLSEHMRRVVSSANGIVFSSATYAKRPSSMAVYAEKTDIKNAFVDENGDRLPNEKMIDTIEQGGVPLQQALASMLAESGQYIRRERSFEGVEFKIEKQEADRAAYDGIAEALNAINDLSNEIAPIVEAMNDAVGGRSRKDNSVGEAGVKSTTFSSIMHNLIEQMILSMSADKAADEAIAAIERGEKPVISVGPFTMASAIPTIAGYDPEAKDMQLFDADSNPVLDDDGAPVMVPHPDARSQKVGKEIDGDFSALLKKYIERSRTITEVDPWGNSVTRRLEDHEIEFALASYERAIEAIDGLDLSNVPASPIDWIKYRIREAGYEIGEWTGRGEVLEYSGPGKMTLQARPSEEIGSAGRDAMKEAFNNGDPTKPSYALIGNRSMSTGWSGHASAKYKDQRTRRMIMITPDRDINEFMQMLGRIHRTGQVALPKFTQFALDVPAMNRPLSMLMKKLASLNANSTGARSNFATSNEVPDLMNVVGDHVVTEYLTENMDMNVLLGGGNPLATMSKDGKVTSIDPARRATGRAAILPLEVQEEFWAEVTRRFHDRVAMLEAQGETPLEAKLKDYKATTKDVKTLAPATGPGVFDSAVQLEEAQVDILIPPETPDQIAEAVAKAAGITHSEGDFVGTLGSARRKPEPEWMQRALSEFGQYREAQLERRKTDEAKENFQNLSAANLIKFNDLRSIARPGHAVVITNKDGVRKHAVIKDVIYDEGITKNPLALSAMRVQLAVASATRPNDEIPFSQLTTQGVPTGDSQGYYIAPSSAREFLNFYERLGRLGRRRPARFLTGNLPRALAIATNGIVRGQITKFTRDDGTIVTGVEVPPRWEPPVVHADDRVALSSARSIAHYLRASGAPFVGSPIGDVQISQDSTGGFTIAVSKTRKHGGRFFLSKAVQSVTGEFVTKGKSMVAHVPAAKLEQALQAMRNAGMAPIRVERDEISVEAADLDPTDNTPPDDGPGGGIDRRFTKRMKDAAPAARDALQSRLNKLGLGHIRIAAEADTGDAQAKTVIKDGEFEILIGATVDPIGSLNHEAIHVLKGLGLFTDTEWASLERAAKSKWMKKYRVEEIYSDYAPEQQIEEAIAEAFADWAANQPKGEGLGAKAMQKLRAFMRAIGEVLARMGLTTPGAVFARADDGIVGQRERDRLAGMREAEVERRRSVGVGYGNANRTIWEAIREDYVSAFASDNITAGWRYAVRNLQDRFRPWLHEERRISEMLGNIDRDERHLSDDERPHMVEGTMRSKAAMFRSEMREEYEAPIIELMAEHNIDVGAVDDYLVLRHADERDLHIQSALGRPNGSGVGSEAPGHGGMTYREVMERDQGTLSPDQLAALDEIGKIVDDMNDRMLDFRVQMGLMSQDQADTWRSMYDHYVPLKGFSEIEEQTESGLNTGGSGLNVAGPEAMRAKGRGEVGLAADILATLLTNVEEAAVRGHKNEVGQTVLNMVRRYPGDWKVLPKKAKQIYNPATGAMQWVSVLDDARRKRPNVISVKEDGKEALIELGDDLARAFSRLDADQISLFTRWVGAITRTAAMMMTRFNPGFWPYALAYDAQTAAVHLQKFRSEKGLTAKVLKRYPGAVAVSAARANNAKPAVRDGSWADWESRFAKAGGRTTFLKPETLQKRKRSLQKALDRAAPSFVNRTKDLGSAAVSVVDAINGGMDNGMRLALFRTLVEDYGYSETRAAAEAKEITVNFDRQGSVGQIANAFIPFYNATAQGVRANVHAFKKNPAAGVSVMSGLVGMGILSGVVNSMLLAPELDDEDNAKDGAPTFWDTLPDWQKQTGIPIMLGDEGRRAHIPVAYGLRAFTNMGHQIAAFIRHEFSPNPGQSGVNGSDALAQTVEGFATSFLPVDASGMGAIASSTVAGPILELALNENYFFDSKIAYYDRDNEAPASHMTKGGRATKLSTWLAPKLNAATGGSDISKGALDLHPKELDHLINGYVSGPFRMATDIGNLGERLMDGRDAGAKDVPIVKRIYTEGSVWDVKGAAMDALQDMTGDVELVMRAAAAAHASGDPEDIERVKALANEHQWSLRFAGITPAAVKKNKKQDYSYRWSGIKGSEYSKLRSAWLEAKGLREVGTPEAELKADKIDMDSSRRFMAFFYKNH